jgi:hypothetical protein
MPNCSLCNARRGGYLGVDMASKRDVTGFVSVDFGETFEIVEDEGSEAEISEQLAAAFRGGNERVEFVAETEGVVVGIEANPDGKSVTLRFEDGRVMTGTITAG